MHVAATTEAALATDADAVVVGVFDGERVAHDTEAGGLQALFERGEARTAFRHLAIGRDGSDGGRPVILVGLGQRERFDRERARQAAAAVCGRARELGATSLCWEVPHHVEDTVVAGLVEGTVLRDYRFDRFRAPAETARARRLDRLHLSAHHDIAATVAEATVIATARNRVRDLANRPANDLTPSALAQYAQALARERPGLRVTVLDEAAIREAGMGAFAAVAQGSAQPAQLIELEYDGGDHRTPRTALIGKAVTFDTGGLWLKPRAGMQEMKFDMAGGAAVLEAVAALADLQAPVRVLAVIGATENMISGRSVKPGDIVTALDGTTVEVNNTDAEGRLVLADCITHARRQGVDRIIDIATLTGGVVIALGNVHAGLMSNDDALAAGVERAATRSAEPVWRLPLHQRYADMVKGRYAQITNLTERREAQAITAAEFLHHFARDVPWAHLDIAGTAYDARSAYIDDKGATGFGLGLLVELVRSL
jgi:leucyl aminopeptidase